MRVTQPMIRQFAIANANRARNDMMTASQAIASGRGIVSPADNPVAAAKMIRLDRQLLQLDVLAGNRNTVQSDYGLMDTTLQRVQSVLSEAKELAVQMANDGASEPDRAAGANEMEVRLNELLSLVNRQQPNGNYLFGGVGDDRPPFDNSGVYQGGELNRTVEVGPGVSLIATLTGPEAFGEQDEVFSAMRDLLGALQGNDADGVRASLDSLDDAIGTVGRAQARVGARFGILSSSEDLAAALEVELGLQRSNVGDADIVEHAMKLGTAESVLQSTIQLSQRLMASTLRALSG